MEQFREVFNDAFDLMMDSLIKKSVERSLRNNGQIDIDIFEEICACSKIFSDAFKAEEFNQEEFDLALYKYVFDGRLEELN